MKICITSTGSGIDARVDERFGRASYFLIVDTDTLEFEAIKNPAQAAAQGAGISAAQVVSDKGVEAVLTGSIGPNAFNALRSAKIKVYQGVSGADTIRDAIEKFKKGEYKEASFPSGGRGRGFRGGMW